MPRCDVCGNDYHRSFEVRQDGCTYVFDSFECAIHRLAPRCSHCECRIVGHGLESNGSIYCCANCARHAGVRGLVDNTATDRRVDSITPRSRP